MTFTIYANQAEDVKKRLDRLAKKAASYSIPFSYIVGEEHPQTVAVRDVDHVTQTIHTVNTYTVAAVDVTVNCEELIRANGWTVRAKVEHGEHGNIVSAIGRKPVEREWYTAHANCDHCKTNRFRAVTYFCEHENGEVRQVGRNCLKDYTGINPATAAMWAEVTDILGNGMDCTADEWVGHSVSVMYSVKSVLAHAYDAILEYGYRKSDEPNSTRNQVTERVLGGVEPSAEGKGKAAMICDWLIRCGEKVAAEDAELNELWNLYCADGDDGDERYWSKRRELNYAWDAVSDLERNCVPLAMSGYAMPKHFGRLVYMPVAYERYMERKARAEQREAERLAAAEASQHVGTVGQRITITAATAKLVTSWEGYYGVTFLYRFADANGNVYVWRASKSIEVRDGMTIKGTVKEHSEYNGVKQTVVTRCAVA